MRWHQTALFALLAFCLATQAAEKPNSLLILADDMGYSDIGCYGGEIQTPNLDALAANGLRFTQFYNTARCCPTRASLLTGLHPHQAGIGHMMDDRGYDGYRGKHYQKVKEIVASGALGRVHTVYGTATGWMTHMIGYSMWYNDYSPGVWAMAQAAGKSKFTDNHPSPDYIGGFVQFANGVRGICECGVGAPDQPEVGKWWGKNRIGAQGTEGFAEVLTNGGWRAVTKTGGYQSGEGVMNYDADRPPYIQEMADWLDDSAKVHQCNLDHACLGAEVMLALQRSAAEGGQVALPLTAGADEQALLKAKLSDKPVLVSCEQNKKEFGLG